MDIQQEFQALSETVLREHSEVFQKQNVRQLEEFLTAIRQADRIFVTGTGREGISARSFAMRLAHLGKTVHWLWDDTTPAMNEGDLFIVIDGRAGIPGQQNMLQKARASGASIAMVTGNPSGPHAGVAHLVLYVPAKVYECENPKSVPSQQLMGALFEQHLYLLFDIAILMLMRREGLQPEDLERRHRNVE